MNTGDRERVQMAEAVREACARAAAEAFEDAALRGLCFEGAVEAAVGAIRAVDVGPIARGGASDEAT